MRPPEPQIPVDICQEGDKSVSVIIDKIILCYVVTVKAHPAKSARHYPREGGKVGVWKSDGTANTNEAYSFLRGVAQNPSLPVPRSWRVLI
jgi:hypothetical protein